MMHTGASGVCMFDTIGAARVGHLICAFFFIFWKYLYTAGMSAVRRADLVLFQLANFSLGCLSTLHQGFAGGCAVKASRLCLACIICDFVFLFS